jgi:hypothetical protein
MKNLIFYAVIAIALMLAIGVLYRKPNVLKYDKQRNMLLKTKVHIDTNMIDLGDLPLKSSIRGKYIIHNMGEEDFAIDGIMTNCSCTKAEYSKDVIKPKGSTTILLKYDSTRLGVFQSTGIVSSNATTGPVLLVLRGNVIENK